MFKEGDGMARSESLRDILEEKVWGQQSRKAREEMTVKSREQRPRLKQEKGFRRALGGGSLSRGAVGAHRALQ